MASEAVAGRKGDLCEEREAHHLPEEHEGAVHGGGDDGYAQKAGGGAAEEEEEEEERQREAEQVLEEGQQHGWMAWRAAGALRCVGLEGLSGHVG